MPKRPTAPAPIPNDQYDALVTWKAACEEDKADWKKELEIAWMHAGSKTYPYDPALQRLRNQLGPRWLKLVNADLSNVTTKPEA